MFIFPINQDNNHMMLVMVNHKKKKPQAPHREKNPTLQCAQTGELTDSADWI